MSQELASLKRPIRLFITGKASVARVIAQALSAKGCSPQKHECYYQIKQNKTVDIVTWCGGHFLSLVPPEVYEARYRKWDLNDLPIIPGKFPEQWQWKASKANPQLTFIQQALPLAETVVNAGDPDREGQYLVDQALEYCGGAGAAYGRRVQRLHLQSLHWRAVRQSLKDFEAQPRLNSDFQSLSIAAQARVCADWLYGLNMTRAYTLLGQRGGHKGVLSVGRVQTPVLALIVQRDAEIEGFKPEAVYRLRAKFKKNKILCYSELTLDSSLLGSESKEFENVAQSLSKSLQGKTAKVINQETQHHVTAPPLPLNLSRLQIECAKQYGYSALEVMGTAQVLYEKHHLISYPRSSCSYLPEKFKANAEAVLDAININLSSSFKTLKAHLIEADAWRDSACWDNNKVDIHHAIIPTTNTLIPEQESLEKESLEKSTELSEQEQEVYALICRYYLANFFPDYENEEKQLTIKVEKSCFPLICKKTTHEGWKILFDKKNSFIKNISNNLFNKANAFPDWKEGEEVSCEAVEVLSSQTKPPPRFDEAMLIDMMSSVDAYISACLKQPNTNNHKTFKNLGTETTRAYVIDALFKRGYLIKGNKSIYSTTTARSLIEGFLAEAMPLDMAVEWENLLDEIEKMPVKEAQHKSEIFIESAEQYLTLIIQQAHKNHLTVKTTDAVLGIAAKDSRGKEVEVCPECDSVLRRREGKYGSFWGCSNYPACRYTLKIKTNLK